MPPPPPSSDSAVAGLDAEFAVRYETERARWLRKRFLWFCGVLGTIVLWSAVSNLVSLIQTAADASTVAASADQPAADRAWLDATRSSTALDMAGDVAILACCVIAFVYALTRPPRRPCLVSAVSWLMVGVAGITILVAPMTTYIDTGAAATDPDSDRTALIVGGAGLVGVFALHFLGSLFVALTPRESLRPLGILAAIFAGVTLLFNPGSLPVKLLLVAAFPLAGLPGMMWAWWQGLSFAERFRGRMLAGRLGELHTELAYARRIHEALFPPPVTRGPIHVAYRYEPMRAIGGDFLFVHPVAFPPSAVPGAISVVLIDVSGHGVGAALAVNRLHGELLRFFAQHPDGSPGRLLTALNDYSLVALSPQAVYSTALCLRVDPHAGTLTWASAGHPPAFLRRADGRIEPIESTAVMLGVIDGESFQPNEQSCAIQPGDRILAYTDGASEARDAAGELFGIDRLRDLIAADSGGTSAGLLANAIAEAVRRHSDGPPTDDTLLVEVLCAADRPA